MSQSTTNAVSFANCIVFEGVYTGGQPTEAELRQAAAAGIKTVVNLRGIGEDPGFAEAKLATELGMRYVAIPVSGLGDISDEAAERLDTALQGPAHTAIVHCASGNRVGALFALRAFHAGKSVDESLAIGRKSGLTRMEDGMRTLLSSLRS